MELAKATGCATAKPTAAMAPAPVATPKCYPWTLAASEHRHRGSRGGQQGDNDGPMTGRRGSECEGREHREADDDPSGDHRQAKPLHAAGKALPRQQQRRGGKDSRHHCPAEPMSNGDSPSTASRVRGTVNEKAATPRRPHHSPARDGPLGPLPDDPAGDDITGRT
jgi:hypothetical protein